MINQTSSNNTLNREQVFQANEGWILDALKAVDTNGKLDVLRAAQGSYRSVKEIAAIAHVTQPTVKRNLELGLEYGLVEHERRKNRFYYKTTPKFRKLYEYLVQTD